MKEPVKKYFRMFPGNEVRLKGAYLVRCTGCDEDENGEITAVHCTYDPLSRGGNAPDGRKVKGTLHFVPAADCVPCEVRLYDRLFRCETPEDLEKDINPDSLTVLTGCLLEGGLKDIKPGDTYQFMRQGYFCADKDSTPEHIVINRTVALNSSWK